MVYVDGPELYFDNPAYGFPPPPPPPDYFLPPPAAGFRRAAAALCGLRPLCSARAGLYSRAGLHPDARLYRRAPNNVIFENLHNSVMVDRAEQ